MMKAFYDKYAEHLGEGVALKLIYKQVKKALEYAEAHTDDPFVCLATAHDMIEDLFEVTNRVKPELYKR